VGKIKGAFLAFLAFLAFKEPRTRDFSRSISHQPRSLFLLSRLVLALYYGLFDGEGALLPSLGGFSFFCAREESEERACLTFGKSLSATSFLKKTCLPFVSLAKVS